MSGIARRFAALGTIVLCLLGCQEGLWGKSARSSGKPETVVETEPINIGDATEVDLVESLARHRAEYRNHLIALRSYYLQHGYTTKARWAERELEDLRLVSTYAYLIPAAIPGPELKPVESIPEAEQLYQEGMKCFKQGRFLPFINDKKKLKEALLKFNTLIEKYPTSDKIDDAAYHAGYIYKEYFQEDRKAVQYFQRAWEWDPNTRWPARFEAAVLYDYRLHDRDRALELYQEVLEKETFNSSNVKWAAARIRVLTGEDESPPPGEPSPP